MRAKSLASRVCRQSYPLEVAEPLPTPTSEERVTADRRAVTVHPVSDYAAWLASKVSPRTKRSYHSDVADFIRYTGLGSPEDLATVGPAVLVTYRDAMTAAGAKLSTVARRLNTLRSYFNYLLALDRSNGAQLSLDSFRRPACRVRESRRGWKTPRCARF